MKRLLLPVGLLAAAATVAFAAGAGRTVTSPGKVLKLARSEFSVAWLSAPTKGHCGPTVHLWNLINGGAYTLGKNPDQLCAGGPSTGAGVTDLSVSGNR